MLRKAYPLIACGGLAVAVIAFVLAQTDSFAWLDGTIAAALTDGTGGSLPVALTSAGLAAFALVAGLHSTGAPVGGWPGRLLLGWAAATTLLPAVPAEAPWPVPVALSAVAFLTLPAATALLVPALRTDARWEGVARPMEWLALAQGLGLVAITYVALPGHQVMIGLVERLLLGVELAVVGVLAVRLAQLTRAASGARLAKRWSVLARRGGVPLIGR